MTVADLIAILARCPQDLPVATHADNHDAFGQVHDMRVALAHHYAGEHVIIGNLTKRSLNPPNWYCMEELDGKSPLPEEWTSP
jgi:hypothetical protein